MEARWKDETPESIRAAGAIIGAGAKQVGAALRAFGMEGITFERGVAVACPFYEAARQAVDAGDYNRAVDLMIEHNRILCAALLAGLESAARVIESRASGDRPRIAGAQIRRMEQLLALGKSLARSVDLIEWVLSDDTNPTPNPGPGDNASQSG